MKTKIGGENLERILKIENSANTSKVTFAGIDFSHCIYALRFDHYNQGRSPRIELEIDTAKFMKTLAHCSDEELRSASNAIAEQVEYYREYFGINKICRSE